jgi:hypothetical protein
MYYLRFNITAMRIHLKTAIQKHGFTCLMLLSLALPAQEGNPACDFKTPDKLFGKIDSKYTKEKIDKLFGIKGIPLEQGKSDTTAVSFKYQFCDDKIVNAIVVTFLAGKLVRIQKFFNSGSCYSGSANQMTFRLGSTYSEVKEKIGTEGELKMVFWNAGDGKETDRIYEWRSCNKVNYYQGKFRHDSLVLMNYFPLKTDYGRPGGRNKTKTTQ